MGLILGVTGGIGCGKSFVTGILKNKYGFNVCDTDSVAKKEEMPGGLCYNALIDEFGEDILYSDKNERSGKDEYLKAEPEPDIDFNKLSDLIFSDESVRSRVNAIVHPVVWDLAEREADKFRKKGGDFRFAVETALPDERFRSLCDTIWAVGADEETRIKRLVKTRGYSKDKCEEIIRLQLTEEDYRAYGDVYIDNSDAADIFLQISEALSLLVY